MSLYFNVNIILFPLIKNLKQMGEHFQARGISFCITKSNIYYPGKSQFSRELETKKEEREDITSRWAAWWGAGKGKVQKRHLERTYYVPGSLLGVLSALTPLLILEWASVSLLHRWGNSVLQRQMACSYLTVHKWLSQDVNRLCLHLKVTTRGFTSGSVVKNLPANAGDTGQERPHMPWSH